MNKKIKTVVICVCIFLIGFAAVCSYKAYSIEKSYREARQAYDDIRAMYATSNENEESGEEIREKNNYEDDWPDVEEKSPIAYDLTGMQQKANQEVVGWLQCLDTPIDYPVVQHIDDEFYLSHNANGDYSLSGAIFMHCTNFADMRDRNTIVHGHNMNDGSMFGTIKKWAQQDYYEAHPIMYFNSLAGGNYRVEIFACFTTHATSDAYRFEFTGQEDFEVWLDWVCENSLIRSSVPVSADDKVITLSTCAYSFDNARTVVMGKLVPID